MMGKMVTFEKVFEEWLVKKNAELKQSSLVKYRNIVRNYLKGRYEKTDIRKISYDEVHRYILELRQSGGRKRRGLADTTLRTIVTVIRSIFKYADRHMKLEVADLSELKIACDMKILRILSTKEQIRLEEECRKNMTQKDVGVILAMYAGLRIGELCALRWRDIRLDEGIINISRTVYRLQSVDANGKKTKVVVEKPKSKKSIREIPIPEHLKDLLKTRKGQDEEYLLSGSEKIVEPRGMQRYIKKLTEKLEMEKVTCHTLRHTFATRCVEFGVDIKTLSEILGHSSVQITMDRYVHPTMEMKKRSMEKMVEGIYGKIKVS